jgi:hypothetical protein
MLRGIVIPPPHRDHAHRQHWPQWRRRHQYRASQAHAAGMPTQMPHRDYNELQLTGRWRLLVCAWQASWWRARAPPVRGEGSARLAVWSKVL